MMKTITLLFVAAACVSFNTMQVVAFYLPGVAPHNYKDGEEVTLLVNKLTSTHTQLPYDYYDLPYCAPAEKVHESENLGQVLTGK